MNIILFAICLNFTGIFSSVNDKDRAITYNGTNYHTTYAVPTEFIGVYEGRKTGFLKLNANGTGEYKYDILGYAPASCERKPIAFIWGFILDKKGEIIKNERDYGFSYPILLQSTVANSFQVKANQIGRRSD